MVEPLTCTGCGHRFGQRATVFVIASAVAFCRDCASSTAIHNATFFNCHQPGCTARSHEAHALCTLGRAKQLLDAR